VCFESFCWLLDMDGRARALGLAGERYERERERRGEELLCDQLQHQPSCFIPLYLSPFV
jgi:hypothetical protein